MSDQHRALPSRPNLRYLKLEAKRRLAAGEFSTLHDAQLAIAREHGLPSWTALRQRIDSRTAGHALAQLRWVVARFQAAGGSSWVAPGDDELREHFDDRFLRAVPHVKLVAKLTSMAEHLREELIVTEDTPTHARVQAGGRQIQAVAEAEPPHRLMGLRTYRPGRPADPRVAAPATLTSGEVPGSAVEVMTRVLPELGLVGLTVAGGEPGAPVWTATRGWADLDTAEALGPDHRFPACSITTLITATAVLRLVAEGRVALDDRVADHLHTIHLADDAVTVRELLSHTGGVDTTADLFADTVPDLVSLLGPVISCGGVRGEFAYSDGGYAALGQLLADVTGAPYAQAATRLVLEPLGMSDSSFPSTWPDGNTVTGHHLTSEGTFAPAPDEVCSMPSAGGLWTTAADLVRFGLTWSSLLPGDLARQAVTPQAARAGGHVGLGWLLNPTGDIVGHPASGLGTSTSLVVRVRDQRTQVAMTNRQIPIEPVNGQILRAIG